MTSRALALLAAFASPLVMVAAIAGWLYGVWPANPVTLGIAAFAVIFGPIVGIYHVATADAEWEEDEVFEASAVVLALPAPVMTPRAAAAKAFINWRDQVNPAIEQRDRARRASAYIRS